MSIAEGRAEALIRAAIERGELDELPGNGAPLELDDDSSVPEELRMAYRVLRNAGYAPDEVAVRREIAELETLLEPTGPTALATRARLRLGVLRARLAIARGEGSAWVAECAYMERLIERFDRD